MTTFEQKHGRPKPPPVGFSTDPHTRADYESAHGVIGVYRDPFVTVKPWFVEANYEVHDCFQTHAEAIAYAHKLAYERSQQ